MSVMKEQTKIVGVLHAQGNKYSMLSLAPQSRFSGVSPLMRDYVLVFSCVVEGFAQSVIVSKGGFLITPLLEPKLLDVLYYVEDVDQGDITVLD